MTTEAAAPEMSESLRNAPIRFPSETIRPLFDFLACTIMVPSSRRPCNEKIQPQQLRTICAREIKRARGCELDVRLVMSMFTVVFAGNCPEAARKKVTDHSPLKERARIFFAELQDEICGALE